MPEDNATRRLRCYAQDIDTWFYFEFGPDGFVTRQVELEGPERSPVAAVSKVEWRHAVQAGRRDEYEAAFGATADNPLHVWEFADDWVPHDVDATEFESVWSTARAECEARARTRRPPEP